MTATAPCPCGSGKTYDQCCRKFHEGAPAPTAGTLMRSRYCAYVLGLETYLQATWHPSTRPASLALDETPRPQWMGLEIKRADGQQVEFVARYKMNGRAHKLHEVSDFVLEDGRWYYHSGQFPQAS